MDYPFEHPDFQGRSLVLRIGRGPTQLVVDGAEIRGAKGKFSVHDNQGQPRTLKLTTRLLDPIPVVVVDGTKIDLVPPLAWYEYAWMGLPILLVFTGGALGGLFGAAAGYYNTRVFRSDRGTGAKYTVSGLVSLGAVACWLASVTVLQLWIASNVDPASKQALVEVARVTNQKLPMMIDDQTELVKLEGLEGVLVYHHRLAKVFSGQISGETLVRRLRPLVTSHVCATDEVRKPLLDQGVVIRYVYGDPQGNVVAEFDVSVDHCL